MHDKQTQANQQHSTFWSTPNLDPGESFARLKFNFKTSTFNMGTGGLD